MTVIGYFFKTAELLLVCSYLHYNVSRGSHPSHPLLVLLSQLIGINQLWFAFYIQQLK